MVRASAVSSAPWEPQLGVAWGLSQDQVDQEWAAPEDLVAGAHLDPVAPDLLDPHALEVGDDVGRGRVGRDLDPEPRRLLQRRLAGRADDLERQLVRAGRSLQDGHDEAP